MLGRMLDRPVSVTMAALVFVILGCVGICRLPVSLIPDVDIPYITVQIDADDLSAREMDAAVADPLRQSFVQLPNLVDMTSQSRDGSATISLSFEQGCNIDYACIEVNEKVDRAMSSMPGIRRPRVFKASATDIPSFYINMTLAEPRTDDSDRDMVMYPVGEDFREMSDFARNVITKRLEQLPEVAMVDVTGVVSSEILVVPELDVLESMGISLDKFESYLSSADVHLANLTIRDGEYHYNVKFQSFVKSREDIENVCFRHGDRTLQIKDVAQVIRHPAPRSGLSLSKGRDAVILAVVKQSDARMADLKRSINKCLDDFREDYPSVEFTPTRDQTELLEYSIRNLLWNIIVAILLDCLIIFLFMKDFKSPLLVSLTIPVSLVMSFFVFYAIGLSINIISLSGLLLGVGMMVDNSIIVTDNITSRWIGGDGLRTAVIEGTKEVTGPMLSSVLTTCAVFLPLVFLNGLSGDLFFDQAVAVTVVLFTSYLVTVILIPVYYWALYRRQAQFKPNEFLSRLGMEKGLSLYDRTVSFFLSHKYFSWVLPLCCIAVAVLCCLYMPKSKLPEVSYSDAVLNVDWNEHITLEENRARMEALTQTVREKLCQESTMVGVPQFVMDHGTDQSINEASLYFKCDTPRELERVKGTLEDFLHTRYPGASSDFSTSGNVFEMVFSQKEPQLLAHLHPATDKGLDVDDLIRTLPLIRECVPEARVEEPGFKTDVLYVSDPYLMSLYGVSFSELSENITNSLNGNKVFEIVSGDESVPVVLGTDVREMEDILSGTFIHKDSVDIPLNALLRQNWVRDFKTITAGPEGVYYPLPLDVKSSRVPQVCRDIRSAVMSEGKFDVTFSGAYFSNMEMIRQMAAILLVAVLLLFLILASQFESLLQPLIILSELIIDISVSLLVLWIAGCSINIMSLIGLVVICGIVINDSILKIDTINRLVRSGWEVDQAIHEAGHRRIKAIIMTSLTTVLAVVPFLSRGNMGADLQYPMALVIIAGMTVGTLVSLFYVPMVYSVLYRDRK